MKPVSGASFHADEIRSGRDIAGRDINYVTNVYINRSDVPEPLALSYRSLLQDFREYYVGSREDPAPFGGRARDVLRLEAWIASSKPFGIVLSPAGRGKSALLAHWVEILRSRNSPSHVVYFPISVRYRTNQESTVLTAIADGLAHQFEEPSPKFTDLDQLRSFIKDYLRRATPDGAQLLLVVDGLDETASWVVDRSIFPRSRSASLKVLLAARSLADDPHGAALMSRLGFPIAQTEVFLLEPLDREGLREVIARTAPTLDLLAVHGLADRLFELTGGDPLLVRLYIEALQLSGSPGYTVTSTLSGLDVGINGYMQMWCAEQAQVKGVNPFEDTGSRNVLEVCASAFGPLTKSDVMALAGDVLPSAVTIERAVELSNRLLVGDGRNTGYVFTHPRLAEYVRDLMTDQDRSQWEQRFVEYGRRTINALEDGSLACNRVSAYMLQYYSAHLKASKPSMLGSLVCDSWLHAWEAVDGSPAGFLNDVRVAWSAAKSRSKEGLADQIKAAIYTASLGSTVEGIPGVVFGAAVRYGVISSRQGLGLARLQTELDRRCHSLAAVIPYLQSEHEKRHLWAEWLAVLAVVPDREGKRTDCLRWHAGNLPSELIQEAFRISSQAKDPATRCGMLVHLLPRLSADIARGALAQIFQDAELTTRAWSTFATLATLVPREHRARAVERSLALAVETLMPWERAGALCIIANLSEKERRNEIVGMAWDAANDKNMSSRDRARSVRPVLPLLTRPLTFQEQKSLGYQLWDLEEDERSVHLMAMAGLLSDEKLLRTFELPLSNLRPGAEGALALRFDEPEKTSRFRRAWENAKTGNPTDAFEQMLLLLNIAPSEWRAALLAQFLDWLEAMVLNLPHGHLSVETAQMLYSSDTERTFKVLERATGNLASPALICSVAEHLKPQHAKTLVARSWSLLRRIADAKEVTHFRATMVQNLPAKYVEDEARDILAGARPDDLGAEVVFLLKAVGPDVAKRWLTSAHPESRVDLALSIASSLPEPDRGGIYKTCCAISSFRLPEYDPAAEAYGITPGLRISTDLIGREVPDAMIPGLLACLKTRVGEVDENETLFQISSLAPRLGGTQSAELADWLILNTSKARRQFIFWGIAGLLPFMGKDDGYHFAHRLLHSAEATAERQGDWNNVVVRVLVDGTPFALLPRLLELVEPSGSLVDRGELLQSIGKGLPGASVPRFEQRCRELLDYPMSLAEALSAIAPFWDKDTKCAYLREALGKVLGTNYGLDRVRGVAALSLFCEGEQDRSLWESLLLTFDDEDEFLSTPELGLVSTPKLDLFELVARSGPAWMLPKCFDAGLSRSDLWDSHKVIAAVAARWPEMCSLPDFDEVAAMSSLLEHGAKQGRRILLLLLAAVTPALARTLGPEGNYDSVRTLKSASRAIP